MKTLLTVTTVFSSDSLAYVRLARTIPADFLHVIPRKNALRIIVAACLTLIGFGAVVGSLLAVKERISLSSEAQGFVVILFWSGLLVFLSALANLVFNAIHAQVVNRFLAMELSNERAGHTESAPSRERPTVAHA